MSTLTPQGVSTEESARRVGVAETTGLRWFHKSGGMSPLSLVEPVRGRTLNIVEREQILAGIHAGMSMRAIAGELGRSPSTISRELKRNLLRLHRQDYAARDRPTRAATRRGKYSPHQAQLRADKAAARLKPAKLATNQPLRDEVQARLKQNHSPEQIEYRLTQDFPDDPEMRVSDKTIYQSLFVDHSHQAAGDQAPQELQPARAVLAAGHVHAEDLPVPVPVHPGGEQRVHVHRPATLADLEQWP